MHILLTDLLCCPRCGPDFGLILLAERIENRRVLSGELGCPNCREKYRIDAGFADLRPPPRPTLPDASRVPDPEHDEAEILRVAALLGVREGPGYLILGGDDARDAPELSALLGGIEVVTLDAALRAWDEEEGVSRLASGPVLPFFSRRMRGVLIGETAEVREAVRVVGPGGRVAVANPSDEARRILEGAGLEFLLDVPEMLVGRRG